MLKSLLSAAAMFVLLFAVCFLPGSVSARRCPVKMPETLLSLYQNSDSIYIATFNKTDEGEITENTDDYTAVNIKKHFGISSTLKGESRKFFVLDDQEYRYKITAESTDETDAAENEEASPALKPGESLLLFLKNGAAGEAPRLTDYRDGVKKLSTEHIGIYEGRIKELDAIFDAKEVSEMRIVEWLVRCAEDPATRWEGTFELLQSFQNLKWQVEAAEQRKERIARGEEVEVESEPEDEEAEAHADAKNSKTIDTGAFAKLLDANQKTVLANLLLNVESKPAGDNETKKKSSVHGDQELIELVKHWGDPRLTGFLLEQLRANSNEPYLASQTMNTIAEILEVPQISSLAEKYNEISYEVDTAEVEAEAASDKVVAGETDETETQPETETTKNVEAIVNVNEAEVSDKNAGRKMEKPRKITYKELRDEILQKFLIQYEQFLAAQETESESTAER
ncbi:MAG: hypothetical protein H0V90_00545 [Blastocatellia bacterium]|nr:hypothetical protein [Blastocatellia bacterium]